MWIVWLAYWIRTAWEQPLQAGMLASRTSTPSRSSGQPIWRCWRRRWEIHSPPPLLLRTRSRLALDLHMLQLLEARSGWSHDDSGGRVCRGRDAIAGMFGDGDVTNPTVSHLLASSIHESHVLHCRSCNTWRLGLSGAELARWRIAHPPSEYTQDDGYGLRHHW